jgi:hypothetical protein
MILTMKYIKLTNSKRKAMVDDEDYQRLTKYSYWFKQGYAVRLVKQKLIYLHHDIFKTKKRILFRSKNRLNCKKSNLYSPFIRQQEISNKKSKSRLNKKKFYFDRIPIVPIKKYFLQKGKYLCIYTNKNTYYLGAISSKDEIEQIIQNLNNRIQL